ncbi:hypothetical protein K504DRAFT_412216, partial [Pleomassaria siparia CBS 279.74]
MPRFLVPKRSTAHRVAAIALYKALLSRCSFTALPDEDRRLLRNAIQNKFRKHKKLQSPDQLRLAFRAGYETLDHLDASTVGNVTSTGILKSLIASLPCCLTRTHSAGRPLPRPPHPSKKLLACLPPERAVLNVRPYTKVSQPRHIPILCSANGIPFLRLKKPQPASLSRILRQKEALRIKSFDSRNLLKNYWFPIAENEDQWDAMMDELADEQGGDGQWVDAILHAEKLNKRAYDTKLATDRLMALKMQSIVERETELALKEGHVVMRGRKSNPLR